MSIKPLNHYSLTTPASVYDEESMTALELAGRTAGKVNEIVDAQNKLEEDTANHLKEQDAAIPVRVKESVQNLIDSGAFDEQLDKHIGGLEERVYEDFRDLEERFDEIVAGDDGTTSPEVIDMRTDNSGKKYGSAGASLRGQIKEVEQLDAAYVSIGVLGRYKATVDMVTGNTALVFSDPLYCNYKGEQMTIDFTTSDPSVIYTTDDEGTTVTLPPHGALVYNITDKKLYVRSRGNIEYGDVVAMQTGYATIIGGTLVSEQLAKGKETVNGIAYLGTAHTLTLENTDDFTGIIAKYSCPITLNVNGEAKTLTWDMNAETATLGYYDGGEEYADGYKFAHIIPNYHSFVYNTYDEDFYFRARADYKEGDIVLLQNTYANIVGGALMFEHLRKELTKGGTNENENTVYIPDEKIKEHTSHYLSNFDEVDGHNSASFLFFTDPHLVTTGDWYTEFNKQLDAVKNVYDSTPCSTVLCGGDWLNANDTQKDAAFALGYVKAQMKARFGDDHILVNGNHDTNYQGITDTGAEANTGRLDKQVIHQLHGYNPTNKLKSINGYESSNIIINLDTGIDWNQSIDAHAITQLSNLQSALQNAGNANIIVALHIIYGGLTPDNATVQPIAAEVAKMCAAYNSCGYYSYETNDAIHIAADFSEATGRVRFMIGGHTHYDYNSTIEGIPAVVTTRFIENDTLTFDLCFADFINGKLYMTRIGEGSDRVINI